MSARDAVAWTEGRALPLAVVVSQALAAEPNLGAAAPAATPPGFSSRRLLVDGRTDTESADALYLSRSTVATQVRNSCDKLDVSSRVEVAAPAVRNGGA